LAGLIVSNIKKRPTRTIVSILAVSVGVIMIVLFVGMSNGMLQDASDRLENVKADILFQPSGSSLLFALNNATMPVRIKNILLDVEGIRYVSPMLHQFSKKKFSLVFGIDPVSFNQVSANGIILMDGRLFLAPYECVIDDIYAESNMTGVGKTLDVLNHQFTIVGVFKSGIGARIMVPLETLQELNDSRNKVSIFYITCEDPSRVESVYEFLTTNDLFSGYNITKASDIEMVMSSNLPGLKEFTAAIIVVAILISFLVIMLTMYTTITERTREIGILKSLGATKFFIISLILRESLLLTAIGVVFGLGLSVVLAQLLTNVYQTLPILLETDVMVYVALIALFSGALGSFYPALRAAQQDPVEALMYE